jgi:hypothetical protein
VPVFIYVCVVHYAFHFQLCCCVAHCL